ncbi:MAG: hypothetical protein ABI181_05330 [Mycobacteriaceae bacterium]
MKTEAHSYNDQLLVFLRWRGVPGPQIAEVLAEVDSHVTETGEDPREAFGEPKAYAADIAAALGDASRGWWRDVLTWTTAAYGLGGWVGAWLLFDGASALGSGERGVLGTPAVLPLVLGLLVLAVGAVGLRRLGGREDNEVLDPRTGADMTPTRPRWVTPLMVAIPVLTLGLGGFFAFWAP